MEDEHLAVFAHGLLNSAAAVIGGVTTLRSLLATRCLLDADAEHYINVAERNARFLADSLSDVLVTVPEELRQALDDIDLRALDEVRAAADTAVRRPAHPVGWQSAVAMLRSGLGRSGVIAGLRAELGLTHAEAASATEYACAWLEEARQTTPEPPAR